MRPRRDPVPRAKEAWWWLGGLLTLGLAGGAVVAAGIALWENIDIRQLAPALQETVAAAPVPAMPPAAVRSGGGFEAVLFESELNHGFFQDTTFHPRQIARWREIAEAMDGRIRIVSDAEGLNGVRADELLLVPEAPCVSSDELALISRHLSRGGSIVTNWAFGVRDGTCAWRGWQPLLDLTGAEAIRELTDREALFLTVPTGLPTSAGIDPGTRVELRPDPAIALRMPGERIYWSDWALNPTPDPDGAGADVAVATTTTGQGGRIAWFGLRHGQGVTNRDEAWVARVLANGVRWAAGGPYASPGAWPGAARAALVFALDVEGQEASVNARDAAAMFELEELPVSFYVVSQLVQDDELLARALASAGEVGSQTVDHTPVAGLTPQDQTIRLRRSWNDVEDWVGEGPAGLRPPEETVDAVTLPAWARVGGRYVLASNGARSASPELHRTEAGPMVLLPRLLKDDYTVIVRDITLRSRRLADAFVAGTRKMRAIGGLAVVAGHTQIIAPGPRLEAVRAVADSVRAQGGWWMAEAREVADWWLDRSSVRLGWAATAVTAPDAQAAEPAVEPAMEEDLLVSFMPGKDVGDVGSRIEELWVEVVAPELPEAAIPLVDGTSVDFIEERWGMRVRIGTIPAGVERRVSFVIVGDGGERPTS